MSWALEAGAGRWDEDVSEEEGESAFAPYVGFGVLMASKLGTNEIYCSFSPLKVLKEFI